MKSIGAVILAGGKSLRMGRDKAMLRLEGKTFLERVASELQSFEECLLSVDRADRYDCPGFLPVEDLCPDAGPIGGLYTALRCCNSDWMLAVSADMPLFKKELGQYLSSFVSDKYDAVVTVTRDGRLQPLCAIYAKPVADLLEEQIAAGNHSLVQALGGMKVRLVPLRRSGYPDELLQNVNRPEDYVTMRRQIQGSPVVAVSGVKNSGKTTLLEGVLPLLKARGLQIAIVKHDGHDFNPDVPGTDSYRLREAGAVGVAVYSDYRFMLTCEQTGATVDSLARQFPNADLVLLEGGKETDLPKIEVVRAAASAAPVCNPETLLGIYTDLPLPVPGVPTLNFGDYAGVAKLLTDWLIMEGWI